MNTDQPIVDDVLLQACGLRPKPVRRDDLDAVEAEVRRWMAGNIDDLKVSFQVAHARCEGHPSMLMIEHYCLAGSMEACIRSHGYMMRCAGPITREVHEQEQRIIAEWPATSARISKAIADAANSPAAKQAIAAFRDRLRAPDAKG